MTAGISLIAGKTGAHRAPLQSDSTGKCTKGVVMGRKVWALGGAGAVVVMIIVALVEQRAAAQSGRSHVPQFEPEPLWSQALPNKWLHEQLAVPAGHSADHAGD